MAEKTYIGSRSLEYALLGFLYEQPCNAISLHQQVVTKLGYMEDQPQPDLRHPEKIDGAGLCNFEHCGAGKIFPGELFQITKAEPRRFREWLEKPDGSSVHTIRVESIHGLYFFAEKLFTDMILKMLEAQSGEVDRGLAGLEVHRQPSLMGKPSTVSAWICTSVNSVPFWIG